MKKFSFIELLICIATVGILSISISSAMSSDHLKAMDDGIEQIKEYKRYEAEIREECGFDELSSTSTDIINSDQLASEMIDNLLKDLDGVELTDDLISEIDAVVNQVIEEYEGE